MDVATSVCNLWACGLETARKTVQNQTHKFCIAPMMDWTDRHCRFFHRQMTKHARLYTEMVTADALIFGPRERLLKFAEVEHPVALQLGGSDPAKLADAASFGAEAGYDEINLNVGCPSDRVQSGTFGACLMAQPDVVADLVTAMRRAVSIPVTVKCRIGIDDQDQDQDLTRFIDRVADAGCETFMVHARKAWLNGLSPKQNREVPPLNYERVWRLKQARPDLNVIINGGLTTLAECKDQLRHVDGVMMGRTAYQTPYILADVDQTFFGETTVPISRPDVLAKLKPYMQQHLASGGRLNNITRHILGLYHGQTRGRLYRRHLSEYAPKLGSDVAVVEEALECVEGHRHTALGPAAA